MSNICRVCGNEKRYDDYHRLYKPCDSCNTKRALKYYYNNKDKILERKKNYYHNNKELFSDQIKKRNSFYKNKINDLKNQISLLTEKLNTITAC